MNKVLIAGVVLSGIFAGSAMAADLPMYSKAPVAPAAAPDWTGFYVGGDVGARVTDPTWTTNSWTVLGVPCPLNVLCSPGTGAGNFPLANSGKYDGIGFRFGGYFGYNWQFATTWVAGLEGDFGWGDKTVSQAGVAPAPMQLMPFGFPPGSGDFTSIKTSWDASVRARLGYLITPSFLVYATGGPAWQRVELSASCASNCPFAFGPTASPTFASLATTRAGWTVGAGAEMKFWGNWVGRAEYTFAQFNNIGFNYAYLTGAPAAAAALGGVTFGTNANLDTHTFVVGLGYKFGGL